MRFLVDDLFEADGSVDSDSRSLHLNVLRGGTDILSVGLIWYVVADLEDSGLGEALKPEACDGERVGPTETLGRL